MLITTTHTVEGYKVARYGPLVCAEAVMGTNMFRDYFAGIRDKIGGRSGSFQNALADAREAIIADIQKQAKDGGYNAILGVDIDYGEISGNGKMMLLVAVQGIAVELKPAG